MEYITESKRLQKYTDGYRIWQGIPSIERTKKGRLFITFYSGESAETFGNYVLLFKSDGIEPLREPIAVADTDGSKRCFDPALWIDPLGRLWHIWSVQPDTAVYAVVCDDPDADVLVWSEPFYIGEGVMMNRPTVLSSGEWLFPISVWEEGLHRHLRQPAKTPAAAYVYKTCDNGKTFMRLGGPAVPARCFDEHMVLELGNGVLKMLTRTFYGIAVAYSYDRGNNWTTGERSDFPSPGSRFHLRRLRSGRVLFINHYRFEGRNNLTAMLSEDDGATFPYTLLLDERSDVSYPDAAEGEDGFLYVVYDRERGCKNSMDEVLKEAREILVAKISEEDILTGKLVTEGSSLKNVVSKLHMLHPDAADPFEKRSALSDREFAQELLYKSKQDILPAIFARYPQNCANVSQVDMQRLDTLVGELESWDGKDKGLLIRIIALIRKTPALEQKNCPMVEKALAFIEENLAEDLSATHIAAHCGVSVYYLCHLFKQYTGTSLLEYRNTLRFTRAKLLLKQTSKTVSQIASEVGFDSSAYFSHLFKKHESISPTDYRRAHSTT